MQKHKPLQLTLSLTLQGVRGYIGYSYPRSCKQSSNYPIKTIGIELVIQAKIKLHYCLTLYYFGNLGTTVTLDRQMK